MVFCLNGVIHVGAPLTTGSVHMPRIIELFNQNHTDIEIQLSLEPSASLLSKLLKGDLDLALIDIFKGITLHRDLHAYCHLQPILDEAVVLVCSPEYYETKIGKDLSFEHLSSLGFLSMNTESLEIKSWFHQQYGKSPQYFRRKLTTNNGIALLDCACRGLGLGIMGSNVSQAYVDRGDLVEVSPNVRGDNNQINLVQLLDKKPSTLEKNFIQQIKIYAENPNVHRYHSNIVSAKYFLASASYSCNVLAVIITIKSTCPDIK